jgi:hypothetical protein
MLQESLINIASSGSHTSFYVAAGLLAGWAVLISLVGIARHQTFPQTRSVQMGILALTGALVVAVLSTAVVTG